MKKEPVKRYSQALKQQVVREYEEGVSSYSLRQKYGIGTHSTVERWIKKFGRSAALSARLRTEDLPTLWPIHLTSRSYGDILCIFI